MTSPTTPKCADDLLDYVRIDLREAEGTRSMIECDKERLLGLLEKLTTARSETAPLADALAGLLAHCDYTSDCETDYEKAVHAGRAALNAYIKSVTK